MSAGMRHIARCISLALLVAVCCLAVSCLCVAGRAFALANDAAETNGQLLTNDSAPKDGSDSANGSALSPNAAEPGNQDAVKQYASDGTQGEAGSTSAGDSHADTSAQGEDANYQGSGNGDAAYRAPSLGAVLYDDGNLLIYRTGDTGLPTGSDNFADEGAIESNDTDDADAGVVVSKGAGSGSADDSNAADVADPAVADGNDGSTASSSHGLKLLGRSNDPTGDSKSLLGGASSSLGASLAGSSASSASIPLDGQGHIIWATYDRLPDAADSASQMPWYWLGRFVKRVSFGEDVAPESMAYWFAGFESLYNIDFTGLDTAHVTSMRSLFDGCSTLEHLDLSSFDTSSVTDMSRLFAGCESLGDVDLSHFDTRNVAYMDGMFEGCASMCSIDLSGFDTRNVVSADGMLGGCASLAALDVSGFSASLVQAMSVPLDNKGGFWRMNVPAGFQTGISLREPTAAERAAAGLAAIVGGDGAFEAKPEEHSQGRRSVVEALVSGSMSGLRGLQTVASSMGATAGIPALYGSNAVLSSAFGIASVLAGAEPNPIMDELADAMQAQDAAVHMGSAVALMATIAGAARSAMGDSTRGIVLLASLVAEESAVIDALTKPGPLNPMTPLGIPLSLLATIILLAATVPFTALTLRDRR